MITTAVNTRNALPSPVWLKVSVVPTTNDTLVVTVKAVANQAITSSTFLKIYLTEIHEVWATAAPNGVNTWDYPFISAKPSVAGFPFTHSGSTSDTLTFTTRFAPRTTGTEPYNIDSCSIIAFVQNTSSREVLQSTRCHGITSPAPQQMAFIEHTFPIIWNSFYTDTMNILLNRHYPSGTWDTIAANVPNNGYCEWNVNGASTDSARIIVKSIRRPRNADTLAGNFKIASATSITVTPTPFTTTLAVNDTLTQTLTVTNTGSIPYSGTLTSNTGLNNFTYLQTANSGGPAYRWIDTTGGDDGAMGNDATISYDLPFVFPFYGSNYSTVYMNANGILSFNQITDANSWRRQPFPSNYVESCIAVFWNDLWVAQDTGSTKIVYDSQNERVIFSWINARRYSGVTTRINAQCALYEDGTILLQYGTISIADYNTAIGIQSEDRSRFVNIYNSTLNPSTFIPSNNAIRIQFSPYWANPIQTTFSLQPSQSTTVPVLWNSQNMTAGSVHTGAFTFSGNIVPVVVPVTLTISGSAAPDVTLPATFQVGNAYPNPFNPTTSVDFTLAKANRVAIKLFDLTGREVMVVRNERLGAGSYRETIDCSHLATGTYFLKLTAGNNEAVRKIVLIK